MKIVAKKGFEMDVQVSGFQGRDRSEISVSFSAGGKVVKNERASIVRNGKIVEGIYFSRLNGYIECEVSEIEKAISGLPAFVKIYKKVERDLDGIPYSEWIRNDGFEVGGFMKAFLDTLSVDKIEVSVADADYEAQRKVKKSTMKIENIMFDNESGGIEKTNGFEVDRFAMVGMGDTKHERR